MDAVARELGRKGGIEALRYLLNLADQTERTWVAWKLLASAQEILIRVDPTSLRFDELQRFRIKNLAPILRDLAPGVASDWAWTLWEHRRKWLTASFRSRVPLKTRLWLARAFAADHPETAVEVFREGLQSNDSAIRTATEMFIRNGLGGSRPQSANPDDLLNQITANSWEVDTPLWDTLPTPLNRPFVLKLVGGRRDIVWVSANTKLIRSEEDVWPLIQDVLPNGLCYSRVGDVFPIELALTTRTGQIHARFSNIRSWRPSIATHGGFWAITKSTHATEFFPDGSTLWDCPLTEGGSYRHIAPISRGRTLILGSAFLECRDRRGDIWWRTDLKDLVDPRYIYPISDYQFLVCCTNSLGLTNAKGLYEPVMSDLKSAIVVRYHPEFPWVVFDGGAQSAIIFDPSEKKRKGHIDLNDRSRRAKSQFIDPPGSFPE